MVNNIEHTKKRKASSSPPLSPGSSRAHKSKKQRISGSEPCLSGKQQNDNTGSKTGDFGTSRNAKEQKSGSKKSNKKASDDGPFLFITGTVDTIIYTPPKRKCLRVNEPLESPAVNTLQPPKSSTSTLDDLKDISTHKLGMAINTNTLEPNILYGNDSVQILGIQSEGPPLRHTIIPKTQDIQGREEPEHIVVVPEAPSGPDSQNLPENTTDKQDSLDASLQTSTPQRSCNEQSRLRSSSIQAETPLVKEANVHESLADVENTSSDENGSKNMPFESERTEHEALVGATMEKVIEKGADELMAVFLSAMEDSKNIRVEMVEKGTQTLNHETIISPTNGSNSNPIIRHTTASDSTVYALEKELSMLKDKVVVKERNEIWMLNRVKTLQDALERVREEMRVLEEEREVLRNFKKADTLA
ncbi:hypothetical protein JR316_0012441 [Psilocybe cubensis]|uniref:Uncharacterized protein n=2 Tax=Psilocybe cubensis TaxID=181762 RepID=A0A8H8CFW3_PSICU|nr:hypothetical protein JR316_0012441 [Psilocybe cubensis]KAH9475330.1 hypothetical protein JR316_0012441 [Psilocybe cubensis]